MAQLYNNDASAFLPTDVLAGDTTITLNPGEGERFPLPDNGDDDSFSLVTLEDVNANIEICKMTERNGDILTVVRAWEDTSAKGFATGSRIEGRLTAGSLSQFKQQGDVDFKGEGKLETDGLKIWHQDDPSSYSYYTLRYWTNLAGTQVCEFEAPDIAGGTVWAASVIGTDGGKRNIALGLSDDTQSAGLVGFRVPGNLKFQHRTRFREQVGLWMTWDTDYFGGNTYQITPQSAVETASYKFICRDDQGDYNVGYNSTGAHFAHFASCVQHIDTSFGPRRYVTAYGQNPLDSTQDWVAHTIEPQIGFNLGSKENLRQFMVAWQVNERVVVGGSTTYEDHWAFINFRGNFQTDEYRAPIIGQEMAPKQYVDDTVTSALAGSSVDVLAASVYGRTRLWNSDGGAGPDSGVYTLENGAKWTDFLSIEITALQAESPQVYNTTTIDTQTLMDKGYGVEWVLIQDAKDGNLNVTLLITPLSLTTFSLTTSVASGVAQRLTRILGMFPATS
jgi:hypothetical protein